MKLLTSVLKDPQIQNYISEKEDSAFEYLKSNFSVNDIYEHITNNINLYINEDDLEGSYENIKLAASSYTIKILNEAESNATAQSEVMIWDFLGRVNDSVAGSAKDKYADYSAAADFTKNIGEFKNGNTKEQLEAMGGIFSIPIKKATQGLVNLGGYIGETFAAADMHKASANVVTTVISKSVPGTSVAKPVQSVYNFHPKAIEEFTNKVLLSDKEIDETFVAKAMASRDIKSCVAEISNQQIPKGGDYFQNVQDSFERIIPPGSKNQTLSSTEISYFDKFFETLASIKNTVTSNILTSWEVIKDAFNNNSPYAYGGLILLLGSIAYVIYLSAVKVFKSKKK